MQKFRSPEVNKRVDNQTKTQLKSIMFFREQLNPKGKTLNTLQNNDSEGKRLRERLQEFLNKKFNFK